MANSWRYKVYQMLEKDQECLREYIQHKEQALHRDKYKCQMCGITDRLKSLTAHHIKPRSEGGLNILQNLITLCDKCHDIAEEERLSKIEMLAYYAPTEKKKRPTPPDEKDWPKWIYGGYKNPDYERWQRKVSDSLKQ